MVTFPMLAFTPPMTSSIWNSFTDGLKSALLLHRTLGVFAESHMVRVRTAQCVLLNAGFLFSLWIVSTWLLPLIHAAGTAWFGIPSDPSKLDDVLHRYILTALDVLIQLAFQACWFLPFYVLSMVLTTVWFQDIAEHAYQAHFHRKPATQPNIAAMISEELYRLLVVAVLMLTTTILSFLPYIGQLCGFAITCFVYSFYSFEYVWAMSGVDFVARIHRLEGNWPYYLGFGIPCTAAAFFGSRFVNAGAYAMVFPFSLLLALISPAAIDASHDIHRTNKPSFSPLRLFSIPKAVSLWVLSQIAKVLKLPTAPRRSQPQPADR